MSVDSYTSVLGSRLRHRATGEGTPTLVFLHGFGGSLEEWEAVVSRLDCGRAIALDLLGFGESDRPRIPYDLETHRRYLLALMDSLDIERAVLVGRSMGGSIAAWTAAHSPYRVEALALFAPSGFPGSLSYPWPYSLLFRPGWSIDSSAWLCAPVSMSACSREARARQALGVASSYNEDFAEALASIRQPTLLAWSRGDRTVPFQFSSKYRAAIPHLDLVEMPSHAGHDLARFAPARTATHLCSFIRRLPKLVNPAW